MVKSVIINGKIREAAGVIQDFGKGGSEHRGGSLKQGVWGAQPPRSYRLFPFYSTEIMPKCKI